MQFASPYFLWLLAVIPLVVVYYVWRTRQGGASIQVSTIDGVAETKTHWAARGTMLPLWSISTRQ